MKVRIVLCSLIATISMVASVQAATSASVTILGLPKNSGTYSSSSSSTSKFNVSVVKEATFDDELHPEIGNYVEGISFNVTQPFIRAIVVIKFDAGAADLFGHTEKPLIPGLYSSATDTSLLQVEVPPGTGAFPKNYAPICISPIVSTFQVTKATYEVLPGLPSSVHWHIVNFAATFKFECDKISGSGTLSYSTDKIPGSTIPPVPSPDNSGGSGSGGGGGGTPTPTPTPTPQPTPNGPVVVLSDELRATPIVMGNAASTSVHFSTFVPDTTAGNVTLSASSDADDLLVSVTPSVITATGTTDAVVTIRTTPTTFAGDHAVTITATASDGTTSSATIFVTVVCDPPFILGIDQPKGSTVGLGRPATLSVKATGSGPFTYQWFTGSRGLVNFPLAGGTSSTITTSALNDTTSYWVRVTNPCGSIDSQTATVNVTASGAKP